jgi:hypothetical protein
VQDLGFTLFVAEPGPSSGHMRDEDLLARAARSVAGASADEGAWVVSPRVEASGNGLTTLRIVVVPPNGRELRVRVETVAAEAVSVRGLVMLRDMLSPSAAAKAAIERERSQMAGSTNGIMSPLRSQGRAVLAVNAGLFGGFTAFSLQRASGSDDPRVLYPLLALGTGIGVGGALLAADEWDVTSGDAWFVSAGTWWGAASAYLLSAGYDVQPLDDRYAWAVGGGLIGATLATVALTQTTMDEGDAMLTHSGAALGLLLGGAGELLIRGMTPAEMTPSIGMGYGTAVGLVAAGALATRVTISTSRVLLIDVGTGAGALLGAAAASPLIFQDVTAAKTRGWLTATVAGSLVGGVAAYFLTRESSEEKHSWLEGTPTVGVIGATPTASGSAPVWGVSYGSRF